MLLQSDTKKKRFSTKISFFSELLQFKCFSFLFSFTFILVLFLLYFCKDFTNFEINSVELIRICNYIYSRSFLLITLFVSVAIFLALIYVWIDEELNRIFIIIFLLIIFIFILSIMDGPVSPDHVSCYIFIKKYFYKLNDYNKIIIFIIAVVYCLFLFLIIINPYKFYTYGNYTCFFNTCRVLLPCVLSVAHYTISDLGLQTYFSFRLLLSFFTSTTFLFTFAPALVLTRSRGVTILPTIDEIPKITNPLDIDNIFGLQ